MRIVEFVCELSLTFRWLPEFRSEWADQADWLTTFDWLFWEVSLLTRHSAPKTRPLNKST